MPLRSIHHVQLVMPPSMEEEARAFYAGLLGMDEAPKPENLQARGGCWFESGSVQVHLGVDPDFRPGRKAHPAFIVDDLEDLRSRLTDGGVEVEDDQPLPGFARFYARDPFGNRIEFLRPNQ